MPVRRERIIAMALAAALVIARSAVFLFYEQSFFDSDQAIVGLMAKHLTEGRAFPLFYYGQAYLLAFDAWVAAPFFLVAGPTVAALHLSLVFTNLVTAALLIVGLERWGGLRPLHAVLAAAFFLFAPPIACASLIEAGATIGPMLFVVLLWFVRNRPLWFGALLAIGFLNREFTIYAVPVLVAGDVITGTLFRTERIRHWLLAAAAFLAVWQLVDVLKPLSDLMGPGTRGQLVNGALDDQVSNILTRMNIVPSELPGRAAVMFTDYLPKLLGARFADEPIATQGRNWLWWPLGLGLLAAAIRAAGLEASRWRQWRSTAPEDNRVAGFGWYLLAVGLTAVLVYVLTRRTTGAVDRYMLLAIYLPVGIVAVHLAREPRRLLRQSMIALVLLWMASSAADHWRQAVRYAGPSEPNEIRVLADALVARNIPVAQAGYWRAYKLTFLAGERVKVASNDGFRIQEYQLLAEKAGSNLVVIGEAPCAGGERILGWYLCRLGQ